MNEKNEDRTEQGEYMLKWTLTPINTSTDKSMNTKNEKIASHKQTNDDYLYLPHT